MIIDHNSERPKIEYPCEWEYKVIGASVDNIIKVIEEAAKGLNYTITPSNVSKNEKYFSLNFKVEVPNEVVRDLVYQKLEESAEIKIVL